MAVDYTPWVSGVTQFKADQMNAPLEELKDSANLALADKSDVGHDHDDAYYTEGEVDTLLLGKSDTDHTHEEYGTGDGDVAGPASATDNAIARYHETTGKIIQDSPVTISDAGTVNIPSGQTYNIDGSPHTHDYGSGDGDVAGPESSTDNTLARFDGISGKTIQGSLVAVDDSGTVNIPSGQTYNINGSPHGHSLDGGVGISFEATVKPGASALYSFMCPYAMTIPANCTGSAYYNATNPTAEAVISIKKNGTEFATCTVSTGGVATFDSSETSIAAGDRITFGFPASQDSTLAGVALTIKGTRTV